MKQSVKKVLALLLAMAMLIGFTACGKDEKSSAASGDESAASSSASSKPFDNTLSEPESKPEEPVEAPELAGTVTEKATAVNPDIVGYLQIPGTDIDEPVVQTYDNKTYMRLNYEGKYDFQGSYWVDYECSVGDRTDMSRNTIIYGHNTAVTADDPNGLDFAQLLRFTDKKFAEEHPYIYFSTGEEDMVWEVFAVFYTDLNFRYHTMIDSNISTLISGAQERSEFDYDVAVDASTDKVLTLSTCTAKYGYRNGASLARFVVMARLVEQGAELDNSVTVSVNTDKKTPNL